MELVMIYVLLIAVFMSLLGAQGNNDDKVVLVHGLGDDSSTWGYVAELEEAGLDVILVDIGSFDSNWDRACQLYAQLKGTVIDYGACHASEAGHERYGADYTGQGLYPEWSEENQLHFIGHSMGGMTIRILERMLEEGSGCSQDVSPLFTGGKSWITSITAISSPLRGTTIFSVALGQTGLVADGLINSGIVKEANVVLPQWGLLKQPDESFQDYWNRVKKTGLLNREDISSSDLREDAVEQFTSAGPTTYPDRHYFSYATKRTRTARECLLFFFFCDVQVPEEEMSEALKGPSRLIGRFSAPEKRENDGVVNTANQRCPTGSVCVAHQEGDLSWAPNQWNYIDIDYLDHLQVVTRDEVNDVSDFLKSARRLYMEHGLRLKSLSSRSRSVSDPRLSAEKESQAASLQAKLQSMTLKAEKSFVGKGFDSRGLLFPAVIVGMLLIAVMVVVHARQSFSLKREVMDPQVGGAEAEV